MTSFTLATVEGLAENAAPASGIKGRDIVDWLRKGFEVCRG